MKLIGLVLLIVSVLLGVVGCAGGNGEKAANTQKSQNLFLEVKKAAYGLETSCQRRRDVLQNLLNTLKGNGASAKLEEIENLFVSIRPGVYSEIVVNDSLTNESIAYFQTMQDTLSAVTQKSIQLTTGKNTPTLSDIFTKLVGELESAENRISKASVDYNKAVADYNEVVDDSKKLNQFDAGKLSSGTEIK